MQRQRGELVPIGDALSGMGGPVKAIRDASPQAARHCFTVADQVDQLVGASEADPDRGFMARTMALCSLPRTNPGNRLQYKRVNGPFTLGMIAGLGNKLPFGNLPRLIVAWLCTEVVRTGSREIVLGKSLSDFMRALGVYSSSGGKYTPASQSNEAAVWLHRLNDLRRQARRSIRILVDRRAGRVLVERTQARRSGAVGQ